MPRSAISIQNQLVTNTQQLYHAVRKGDVAWSHKWSKKKGKCMVKVTVMVREIRNKSKDVVCFRVFFALFTN